MRRLTSLLGILALVVWTGAGALAWAVVKDRVDVTVALEGDARDRDDALAGVDEQVRALRDDLRGLAAALGENFTRLDETLDARIDARFDGLQGELAASRARFDALVLVAERGLRAAAATPAVDAEHALVAAGAAPPDPGGEPPAAPAAAAEPAAEPEPAAAAESVAAAEPTAPPAAKKRSFLAFELPSDRFDFAGRHRWDIVGSISRVGFDAKSTLHDFTGATRKVEGWLDLDLAELADEPTAQIRVDAATLDTGLADRNTAMCEHLGTGEHPTIEFELTALEPKKVDAAGMQVEGSARGRMTIHGVTRDVTMPVRMQIDDSRRLVIDGEMPLLLSDYDVEVPSRLGLISMQDEVRVWIALRARAAATEARHDAR